MIELCNMFNGWVLCEWYGWILNVGLLWLVMINFLFDILMSWKYLSVCVLNLDFDMGVCGIMIWVGLFDEVVLDLFFDVVWLIYVMYLFIFLIGCDKFWWVKWLLDFLFFFLWKVFEFVYWVEIVVCDCCCCVLCFGFRRMMLCVCCVWLVLCDVGLMLDIVWGCLLVVLCDVCYMCFWCIVCCCCMYWVFWGIVLLIDCCVCGNLCCVVVGLCCWCVCWMFCCFYNDWIVVEIFWVVVLLKRIVDGVWVYFGLCC